MSKSKKSKAKNTQAEANFKAVANEASVKVREKPKDLILPTAKEPKASKKQLMLEMLKRPEGTTIPELEKATGWKTHSVRGALVNLKNKDKHPITNAKNNGPRRYFLKGKGEAPTVTETQPEAVHASEVAS